MDIVLKIYNKIERIIREKKLNQLKKSFKYCGKNVHLTPNIHIVHPPNFSLGDNSLIADYTVIFSLHGVQIGKNCLISSGCGISTVNHVISSPARTQAGYEKCGEVIIEDNVWLGMNVSVLPGIRIGNNSIVGAGSVVTKNIPPNQIWVGNPARYVKDIEIVK
jgi:acetyltransferase-like isoleucine patch superfamily enzyme